MGSATNMIATNPERSHELSLEQNDNRLDNDDNNENEESTQKSSRFEFYKKLVIGLALVGFIIFVVVDSITTKYFQSAIGTFLEWVGRNPAAGFFGVIVVYFIATVLFIPGSLLTLGAGFIFANAFGLGWGVVVGTAAVFIGATIGEIASFFLARYLLREWAEGLTKKYAIFEALDRALQQNGFRIMLLLRLSPIIPFNVINYVAGVTAITALQYCLAAIGVLPGTVLYVFFGASAGSLADTAMNDRDPTITIVIVVIGVVFGVFAIALTSYFAKKQLNSILEERQNETNQCNDDEEKNAVEEETSSEVDVELAQ